MKKVWTLTVALVVLVVIVVACGGSRQEVIEYLTHAENSMETWMDVLDLGFSTQRIALAPVIGEMQEIKRDFAAAEPPDDCRNLRDAMLLSMEHTIEAFLMFLMEEPDEDINREFQRAEEALRAAEKELRVIRDEYGVAQ